MLDKERVCDTRLWIEGTDGTTIETLVEMSLDSAKAWAPTVWLYEGGVSGRQFLVKLPPGSYKLRAEYTGLVWSSAEQKRVREIAMSAERDFQVKGQANVAPEADAGTKTKKCPLEAKLSIHKNRLTAGESLTWTVRFANVSKQDVWCYNLFMLESLDPHCASLFLSSDGRGELWDILFRHQRSVRLERITDWVVLPPGGFLAFDCRRRVREFTIERGGQEGIRITPFGKFALELRLYSSMIGRPPKGVPSWDKFPARTDEILTWTQWRDSAPGEEMFRSNKAEFEVVSD